MIAHWDDVEPIHREAGHIGARWSFLGEAAGTVGVGLRRAQIEPGRWATPAHVHAAEEEIFFVLGGSGVSWQDGAAYDVRGGDCLVHLAGGAAHTLRAGDDGLDVLAFGERIHVDTGVLPRTGLSWLNRHWIRLAGEDDHPFKREAEAGPPEVPEISPRPSSIVNVADVEPIERRGETVAFSPRHVASAAGSVRTGLRHVTGVPGLLSVAPHCHSAEEEIFVVLGGEGALLLWDGDEPSEHPLRAGSVVARPAGTRVAHSFRSGDDPLVYLAYGTRDPRDIAYYPRSNKLFFRGVGVIGRVERLDYWDGEE